VSSLEQGGLSDPGAQNLTLSQQVFNACEPVCFTLHGEAVNFREVRPVVLSPFSYTISLQVTVSRPNITSPIDRQLQMHYSPNTTINSTSLFKFQMRVAPENQGINSIILSLSRCDPERRRGEP
jgi:hypothetical protein